jgi:hypothetical protein
MMAQSPVNQGDLSGTSMHLAQGDIGSVAHHNPNPLQTISTRKIGRTLSIYQAAAGYDLQEELDFLSNRAIEPNVFFSSRFLVPAMPRLDDREIRLAVIRDELDGRSRLRFLMPFSVERPGFAIGTPIIRVWSNPFGPLATPLVDGEGAGETIDNLFEALSNSKSGLPNVLVLPDIRLNGPFAQMARAIAISRNLPINVTNAYLRPMLNSLLDGDAYLRKAITGAHVRDMRRQWANLEKLGTVTYSVARQPKEIRGRMEEFLMLEASGWKGKRRSAMLSDRYQAAFAREAIANLSEVDAVRIHTIDFNGKAIASMVVLLMNGEAFTWKTGYDEGFAKFSPGKLLVAQLTEWHLDDANITRTDSCGVPDHPVMSRLWQEREPMGTLIIGLTEHADRETRQAGAQLHLYQNTRNVARKIREKIMAFAGK